MIHLLVSPFEAESPSTWLDFARRTLLMREDLSVSLPLSGLNDSWFQHAALLTVFTDLGVTPLMRRCVETAVSLGVHVEYRRLDGSPPPKRLLGLVGRKRSGKDTLANFMRSSRHGVRSLACADSLKRACSVLFSLPLNHFYDDALKEIPVLPWNMSPRRMCQWLGTDVCRNQLSPEFHVHRLRGEIQDLLADDSTLAVIVTDVRFDEEAALVLSLGGDLVYIDADSRLGPIHETEHESERHIARIGASAATTCDNNGTVAEFLEQISRLHVNLFPLT